MRLYLLGFLVFLMPSALTMAWLFWRSAGAPKDSVRDLDRVI